MAYDGLEFKISTKTFGAGSKAMDEEHEGKFEITL